MLRARLVANRALWFDRLVRHDSRVVYRADAEYCIRCGSCALLAPEVFAVERRVQILRQPEADSELRRCRAAAIVCRTGAIHAVESAPCRT
jgi:ferredoxin